MSIYGATTADTPLYQDEARTYDAILVMSFGGPEGPDDVMPFLENVTRGRNIPRERLLEVAEHYQHFGGVSPINAQNRALVAALKEELQKNGPDLPIYFGNRNWHPFITDVVQQMKDDGRQHVLTFFTSAFSSYSGCRQYREDIQRAVDAVGEGAPEFDRIRMFYNHPGFIHAVVDELRLALSQFADEEQDSIHIAFTAHSIPMGMARHSAYEAQLIEACRIVSDIIGTDNYKLVYQSRSGSPQVPWLEPDILDYMEEIAQQGTNHLVILPIGFISDHMEVLFDLDTEAVDKANELGIKMVRAGTVGTASPFVRMIRDLIVERMSANPDRPTLGNRPPVHDICPIDCCLIGTRPRPESAV